MTTPSGPLNIVVSGPGGVGKGTVVGRLLERDSRLWVNRSWTTRAQRPGEHPDAYRFVDEVAFRAKAELPPADGGFLEWVEFLDYLQGSPVPVPPPDRDVIFEIDVYGARAVRAHDPAALVVFIDAPSRTEQRRRLVGRGDAPGRVDRRLAKAEEEVEVARGLEAAFVVNDDLDRAVAEVQALIATARRR